MSRRISCSPNPPRRGDLEDERRREIEVEISAFPVMGSDCKPSCVVGFARDITERKQQERRRLEEREELRRTNKQLLEMKDRLIRSEKMAALGNLIAGIEPEGINKIFDAGYTTKAVGMGTGLGLSICQQIMQDHGGRIEVESESGKGSTFGIVLPITPIGA